MCMCVRACTHVCVWRVGLGKLECESVTAAVLINPLYMYMVISC